MLFPEGEGAVGLPVVEEVAEACMGAAGVFGVGEHGGFEDGDEFHLEGKAYSGEVFGHLSVAKFGYDELCPLTGRNKRSNRMPEGRPFDGSGIVAIARPMKSEPNATRGQR